MVTGDKVCERACLWGIVINSIALNGQRPSVLGTATLHRGCAWGSIGMPHLSYLDYCLAPSLSLKIEAWA